MLVKRLRLEAIKWRYYLLIVFFSFLYLLFLHSKSFAEVAHQIDYRTIPFISSRNLIWIVAQVHLYFGAFVLGVPMFAVICEYIGVRTKDKKYDKLAKEFTKLLLAAFSTTATFGAVLIFSLIMFYPTFMKHISDVFYVTFGIYVLLFFGETITLYLYWYGWDTMMQRKRLHLTLGVFLNIFGTLIMMVSNSWASYMMSPTILSAELGFWDRTWTAVNNFTWQPLNIHRLISNVVFGGFIVGAYAAIKFLAASSEEEKAHYDWMGYIGNFIGIFGMLPLPFAGYWLTKEIYAYSTQMGITLMGGFLAWLFIIQAILIAVLFIGSNYYFWLGLVHRIEGGARYKRSIFIMLISIFICFAIWMTPHSMVASLEEARAMGGTHHPLLGVFGVMSAKMTVVNIAILTTFISFLLYWRANKKEAVSWLKLGKGVEYIVFAGAILYILYLGVMGYFVPAIVRIEKYSVYQVLTVLGVLLFITLLTILMQKGAHIKEEIKWGNMPERSQYVLILLAITIIWLMGLMGYARSAVRVHWHIYGVLRDTSPDAYSPSLGVACIMVSITTIVFLAFITFIFWLSHLGEKKEETTQHLVGALNSGDEKWKKGRGFS